MWRRRRPSVPFDLAQQLRPGDRVRVAIEYLYGYSSYAGMIGVRGEVMQVLSDTAEVELLLESGHGMLLPVEILVRVDIVEAIAELERKRE